MSHPTAPGRTPIPDQRRRTWRGLVVDRALAAATRWPAIVLALVAVVMVALASAAWPGALAAAHGDGLPGTFVAETPLSCPPRAGPSVCGWRGVFTSDDGSVQVEDILLDDTSPSEVGATVRAIYPGVEDPAVVYLAEGDMAWLSIALLGIACVLYLVAFSAAAVLARHRHRAEPPRLQRPPSHRAT